MKNNQSGNMLIYILGAIALIGVLIILVRGSSLPGGGIDNEAMTIKVTEIQQYGNELERAVRYILQDGYSESDLRFAHPNHSSAYGDITDEPTRQVFTREGGGATWRDNDVDIQVIDTNWNFNGATIINEIGSTRNDLVAWLPNVTQDFCLSINDKIGIENPADAPPQNSGNMDISNLFDGNFTAAQTVSATEINGFSDGCLEGNGSPAAGTYHYYRVLLAR